MSGVKIAPTAIVCQDAKISGNVIIGAGTIVHPRAEIRAEGGTSTHTSIEPTAELTPIPIQGAIRIGENNIIEELVLIHNPKSSAGKEMVIGNSNLFEVGSQITAEKIGDANVFECRCTVPLNVVVGKGCAIGPAVALKQSTDVITLADGTALHGPHAEPIRVENAAETHIAMLSKHLEVLSKTLPTFHRMANAPTAVSSPAKP